MCRHNEKKIMIIYRSSGIIWNIALLILLLSTDVSGEVENEGLIKAYCIDFNWGDGGPNAFAAPGLWADADPEDHVAWYKSLGVNTIQTFCVSCNGYAWYKNGVVPEQPGLKHNFLREMVRRGHDENMQVMGYFCIGANTRWGLEHPELSYGTPSAPHIPYTKSYLEYLDKAIRDAVGTTGINGFMVDWIWQPVRKATDWQWLSCEKDLYTELMGHDFPGEKELTEEQYLAYSRKAIDRCWKTIHTAAKETNPDCIIWLTCHTPTHPHVVNSEMFKEVDWLMNEAGDMESIEAVTSMTGPTTRLITCLAFWNKQDPAVIIPRALEKGIGLYGFTKPLENSLLPSVENYLSKPVSELKGDEKNIAALARVFMGMPLDLDENKDSAQQQK